MLNKEERIIIQNCINSLESFQEDNSKIDKIWYVLEKLKHINNDLHNKSKYPRHKYKFEVKQ